MFSENYAHQCADERWPTTFRSKERVMTPEERWLAYAGRNNLTDQDAVFVLGLLRDAAAREREMCLALVRQYLLFASQRAVSWHEVQDAIAAIRARGEKAEQP